MLCLFCYFSLRVVPASKQLLTEHVIRHPDVMRQNCRPKTKLGGMNKLRPVLASFTAPIAALLPVLALAAYELNAPVVIINGEADDAPQRALGLLLVGLPVIYVVLALVAFVAGWAFIRIGLVSLRRFILGASVLAVLLAIPFGLVGSNPSQYGLQDLALAITVFCGIFLLMAVPGAVCWWYVAKCHLTFRSSGPPSAPAEL